MELVRPGTVVSRKKLKKLLYLQAAMTLMPKADSNELDSDSKEKLKSLVYLSAAKTLSPSISGLAKYLNEITSDNLLYFNKAISDILKTTTKQNRSTLHG
jgi:hypothetical protein